MRDKMNQADRQTEHSLCFTTAHPTNNSSQELTPSPTLSSTFPTGSSSPPIYHLCDNSQHPSCSPSIEPSTIKGISDTELSAREPVTS